MSGDGVHDVYKKEQQNTAKNDSQRKPCCHYLLTKQLHPAGEQYRAQTKQEKPPISKLRLGVVKFGIYLRAYSSPATPIGMLIRKIQCQLAGDKHTAQHRAKYRADRAGHGDEVEHGKQFTARIGAQSAERATGIIIAPPIPCRRGR